MGVALIEDRGNLKAVRLITATPPDTSTSYQLLSVLADVGANTTLLVSARPGYLGRALMRFAPSNLPPPGSTVDSITLVLPYSQGFGTSPMQVSAVRVTSTWLEAPVASGSFPSEDATVFGPFDVPFADPVLDTLTVRGAALAPLVQAWVNDSTANFGMALVPAAGATGEIQFTSREAGTPPRLTVHYHGAGTAAESSSAIPAADVFSLGTTPAFVPLDQQPRRMTVGRGLPARALVRFTWSPFGPRTTIHRAELTLYIDTALSSGRTFTIGVRRLTAEPWTGSTTPVDSTIFGNTTVSATADSVVVDVTSVLDQLLSRPNHGFEIRSVDEHPNTDYVRFHGYDTEAAGKAPVLRIWYTPGDLPGDNP